MTPFEPQRDTGDLQPANLPLYVRALRTLTISVTTQRKDPARVKPQLTDVFHIHNSRRNFRVQ